MIPLFLFFIGLRLYGRRRFYSDFLKLNNEGESVRRAGIILMLPLVGNIVIGMIMGIVIQGDMNTILDAAESLTLPLLAADISAVCAAYIILKRSASTESIQRSATTNTQFYTGYNIPSTGQVNFPSVMTTQEAAQYLNVPEQQIIDAIYNGELAAASIGYRFKISQSVLNEFRTTLKKKNDEQ
jgi:excisionase family DNA binding protein